MQSVPPGPEQDRIRLAIECRQQAFEQGLLDGPPFPIYSLDSPLLTMRMTGGYGMSDGVLTSVELQCGSEDGDGGPTASAETAVLVDGFCHLVDDLALAIDTQRYNASDEEIPEPVKVEDRRGVLLVDGVETPAEIRVEDEWWAVAISPTPPADIPSVEVREW